MCRRLNIAPLLVVIETYDDMKQGFGFSRQHQPMSRNEAANLIATHPQRSKLEHWLELYRRYDGHSFTAEADEAVLDVGLVNEDGNPKQGEGEFRPEGDDGVHGERRHGILTHVVGGFKFDSAMCDCHLW